MQLYLLFKHSFTNLLSSKLRSILALLGILVGTASVVAMVSAGQLASQEALKQFKSLGTDLLAISLFNDNPDEKEVSAQSLTIEYLLQMKHQNPDIIDIAPYSPLYLPMQFNHHAINGMILGVTDRFMSIINIRLTSGRFVSFYDGYAAFCVIGKKIADQIKKITLQNPLGQQMLLGSHYYTIVGIAEAWPENSFIYANIDHSVMIPLLSAAQLNQNDINQIILKINPKTDLEKIQQQMTGYLKPYTLNKRIFFRSPKELIVRMLKQSQIFTIFLGLIGSISLLVGGIGVMNIMLVSVVERRREIGIRLAVGAKVRDIRLLFLTEAVALSFTGGIMGVIVGLLVAYLLSLFWHWEYFIYMPGVLMGFFVSIATGIFFGYYPAYKASKLNPIDALRAE